jgi:hypothetical protein
MVFPENIKAGKGRGNAEIYCVNHCGLDMPLKSIITVFVLAPVVVVSRRQATGERGTMGAMLRLLYIASMKKEALQMGYVSDPISGVWLGCGCILPYPRGDTTQPNSPTGSRRHDDCGQRTIRIASLRKEFQSQVRHTSIFRVMYLFRTHIITCRTQ